MSPEKLAEAQAAERVRWRDEEQGPARRQSRPPLSRANSADSLAIRSIHSRGPVDPAVSLPIQYRTV